MSFNATIALLLSEIYYETASTNFEELLLCTSNITNRYSEVYSMIAYQFDGAIINDFIRNEQLGSARVVNIGNDNFIFNSDELELYKMATLFISYAEDLRKYGRTYIGFLGWNVRIKNFIILVGDEKISEILKVAWDLYMYPLIILTKDLELFTYDPMKNNCAKNITSIFISNCSSINYNDYDKIFATVDDKQKRIVDYMGCPLKVLTTAKPPYVINPHDSRKPGFEVEIVKVLAKQLNFTLEYVAHNYSDFGYQTSENSYNELYSLLFQRKGEIMFGMLLANGTYLYDFDATLIHTRGFFTFYTPTPGVMQPWLRMSKIFTLQVWSIFLFTFASIALSFHLIALSIKGHQYHNKVYSTMQAFGIIVDIVAKQPSHWKLRFIFMSWAFGALVVSSTFRTALMTALTKPFLKPRILTELDLVDSGYSFGGSEDSQLLFTNKNDADDAFIYKKWTLCENLDVCINRTIYKQDFATMADTRSTEYLIDQQSNEVEDLQIHAMPVFSNFYIWMLMSKGHALRSVINENVQRLKENGFVIKWINDIKPKVSAAVYPSIILRFTHIYPCIFLLGFGLTAAFAVFICEIFYFYKMSHLFKPRRNFTY